jgi:hypothetical protein
MSLFFRLGTLWSPAGAFMALLWRKHSICISGPFNFLLSLVFSWPVAFAEDADASKPASMPSVPAPLAEPKEIQRWTKSIDSLNELTKANWRDFLQSFTDHTIKTGASFDEHWTLALARIREVAGKDLG